MMSIDFGLIIFIPLVWARRWIAHAAVSGEPQTSCPSSRTSIYGNSEVMKIIDGENSRTNLEHIINSRRGGRRRRRRWWWWWWWWRWRRRRWLRNAWSKRVDWSRGRQQRRRSRGTRTRNAHCRHIEIPWPWKDRLPSRSQSSAPPPVWGWRGDYLPLLTPSDCNPFYFSIILKYECVSVRLTNSLCPSKYTFRKLARASSYPTSGTFPPIAANPLRSSQDKLANCRRRVKGLGVSV